MNLEEPTEPEVPLQNEPDEPADDTPETPDTPPTENAPLHRGEATEITETHQYIYAGGKLLRETISDGTTTKTLDFTYDNVGMPYSLIYNNGTTTATYYYITNLQGDVMYLVDGSGNEVAAYDYDPYGKILSATGSMAEVNPLRYRGYYYDSETGFYYASSRYYDPTICRWINADKYSTVLANFENYTQYNLFVYCFNDPLNFVDQTGFWPSWVKKAIAVTAVAAVLVAATVITVATYGAGSVAGVAMISAALTISARATEVAVLQVKKGKQEGKTGKQIAKDSIESIYDNGSKVIGITPVTKATGIAANHYLSSAVEKGFGGKQTFDDTLRSSGGKATAFAFVAIAWVRTIISAFSKNPTARANQRGYTLK